jgi:hypothetical protein
MPKINHQPNRCATSLSVCLCLLAALLLSACGPGTGGTGTGPSVGASPTGFTSSYFTNGTVGTVTAPVATPSQPGGTCTVACTASLDNQALRLYLQADRIELSTPCATFTFAGPWSLSATGEATVQGVLESTVLVNGQAVRSSQNANLTLIFPNGLESSNAVNLSLKDSTGKLLLAPVNLQRAASAPASVSASGC